MEEPNAKTFARDKLYRIIELCADLKYANDKELRIYGIEKINELANRTLEHLEYLEIKEIEED